MSEGIGGPPGRPDPDAADVSSGARGPGRDTFRSDRVAEDADLAASILRSGHGPRWQWPLMVVLVGLVVSLVIVVEDHFRRGSVLFAGSAVLAFFLRLFLTDADAGWLAVRSRTVDLLVLGALGLSLSVFSLVVPSPS